MKGERGFTLLELIVVLSLVSLMLGLSALHFGRALTGTRYDRTVKEIASTFRHARALAKLRGEPQTIVFDFDARTYGIRGQKSRPIYEGVSVKSSGGINGDVSEGRYRLTFYPDGTARGGTLVVFNDKKSAEISVDPVAGATVVKK